jgi:hypothetical protein
MNDDNFNNEDDVDLKDYMIAEKAFSDLRNNDRSPMEAFGIILGMVANQFKKHGWTRKDFVDFLGALQDTDWPDDPKKKTNLTLVKK